MKKSAFRAVCILTAVILLFAAFPLAGFAADKAIDSGSCGSGVTWTFYEDGTLRISGSGPMADYNGFMDEYGNVSSDAPYFNYFDYEVLSVVVEDGITHVGDNAFSGGVNLFDATIASSVRSIGNCAFDYCGQLRSIRIPASVESIGVAAFEECEWLERVEFEEGSKLKEIPFQMFWGCLSLEEINLPAGITSIGSGAFAGCNCLRSLLIPDGVKTIGEYAFADCWFLESLYIPVSVTSVGSEFLSGSYRVKDIYYGGTEAQWAKLFPDGVCSGNQGLEEDKVTIHYRSVAADYAAANGLPIPAGSGKIHGDHCICYDYQGDGMFLNIIRFLCAFYNFVLEMQAAFGA